MTRNVEPARQLIKDFEGLRLEAYFCPAGTVTIGWGTIRYPDGKKVRMGDKITIERAEECLAFDMKHYIKGVEKCVKSPINDNQFCALVSFSYNLGLGALYRSTLLKKLNAGSPKEEVAEEFMRWVNAGGKVLPGLVRRREREKLLFLA